MEKDKAGTECGAEEKKSAGLILAAGFSSRMGSFKPLLPIGDVTAIERVIDTLKKAGVHHIICVTGFQREQLSPVFAAHGVTEAFNPDFKRGMFSSIKAGVAKALEAQTVPEDLRRLLRTEHPPESMISRKAFSCCRSTAPWRLPRYWKRYGSSIWRIPTRSFCQAIGGKTVIRFSFRFNTRRRSSLMKGKAA
jgi:hypothetical protein